MDEKPFSKVYLTGIVRDKLGRKMSKSLGNSPDPIELMNKYGADGVRVGMLLTSPAGNDLPFEEELCEQGRNFSNKIWNAFRLVKGWEVSKDIVQPESAKQAIKWFDAKLAKVLEDLERSYEEYRISEALMTTYKFIWDDFSSWYLEMVKPTYQSPIDAKTYEQTLNNFEKIVKILHPFMPFISEEIWQLLRERTTKEALIIASWPKVEKVNEGLVKQFEFTTNIIGGIRKIRKDKNIPNKDQLELYILNNEKLNNDFDVIIKKLGNISTLRYVDQKVNGANSFRVKSNEYFIPMTENINIEEEINKLESELKYAEGFLKSVQKKLSNERFVNNAPEQVITNERKKEADALAKITTIKDSLKGLKK